MTSSDPLVLVLMLLAGAPLGYLLVSELLPARSRAGRFGTAALAGIGAVTAVTHAAMSLGVRARIALPVVAAAGLAAGGFYLVRSRLLRGAREAGPPVSWPRRIAALAVHEIVPVALIALMLLHHAADVRLFAASEHDATRIWGPKAVRALDEAPPDVISEDVHAHPEYPRGLGILAAAASAPSGSFDGRMLRAVPLLLFALTLLCVFDALSARGNPAGAAGAMVILGSIPLALRSASSGLADAPVAAFILLASVALAPQRGGRPAVLAVLAGAAGALVVKDEGAAFCAAIVLVLAFRLARARRPLAALAAVGIPALIAAPWLAVKSGTIAGPPILRHSLFENLGLVLIRFDTMVRECAHLALGFPDPSPGGYAHIDVMPGGDLVLRIAAVCALILLVGRGGVFPVAPAGLLLLIDFAVVLLGPNAIDWQLVTALNRLVLQVLPVLIVAAVDKVTGVPAEPAAESRAAAAA